jgi:hypothetical protein
MSTATAMSEMSIRPLADLEHDAILQALAAFDNDKMEAARVLGIGKTTIYRKLKEFGDDALPIVRSAASAIVGTTSQLLRHAAVLQTVPVAARVNVERKAIRFLQLPSNPLECGQAILRCPRCRSLLLDVVGTGRAA